MLGQWCKIFEIMYIECVYFMIALEAPQCCTFLLMPSSFLAGGASTSSPAGKKPRVGMVRAVSPSLAQDGVFIGVFTKKAVCCMAPIRYLSELCGCCVVTVCLSCLAIIKLRWNFSILWGALLYQGSGGMNFSCSDHQEI